MSAAVTSNLATRTVLHAATTYPQRADDGVPRFVADLVEALRELGATIEVAAPPQAGVLSALARPWTWPTAARLLWSLWRQLRQARGRVELVHAHWWPVATMALAAGHRNVVVTMHGSDVGLLKLAAARIVARRTLRRCSARICVSNYLANEVESRTGVHVEHVLAHGTDGGTMQAVVTADDPIVFVGRLSTKKGAHDLPAIVAELRSCGATNPLHVIGDGELATQLAEEVAALPPGHGIQLLGRLSHGDTMDSIASAAAMTCPSYFEGYGLACREAIARGTIVIAYRSGGLAEQLASGEDGVLVEPGDIASMGRALAQSCLDLEGRQARRNRAIASESTSGGSWAVVAEHVLQVYETVMPLAAPPAPAPPSNSR